MYIFLVLHYSAIPAVRVRSGRPGFSKDFTPLSHYPISDTHSIYPVLAHRAQTPSQPTTNPAFTAHDAICGCPVASLVEEEVAVGGVVENPPTLAIISPKLSVFVVPALICTSVLPPVAKLSTTPLAVTTPPLVSV
jgi:hypothetical protein